MLEPAQIIKNAEEQSIPMPEHRAQMITRLKKLMDENQLSLRDVCDQIPGVSKSTLSYYLRGKYKAVHSAVDDAVKMFLNRRLVLRQGQQGREEKLPYTLTTITDQVTKTCKMVQRYQDLGAVCSYIAGVGKTIAAKHYANARDNAHYLYCGEVYKTAKNLFVEIARAVTGTEPPKGHIATLYEEIINRVRNQGALIILDECDPLTIRTLNAVRQIRDNVEVGILFMGNVGLHTNLTRFRGTYLSQFFSRIKVFQMLQMEITIDDVRGLVTHYHDRPSDGMLKWLMEYAEVRGFRMMENLMDIAKDYAQSDGREKFNLEDLEKASHHLML